MGKPLICVGHMAQEPYYFEKVLINLYSVEELCYIIVREAYLLDQDLLDRQLTDWIDKECGLPNLARELNSVISQRGSVSAFAAVLLEYVGFETQEVIEETIAIIRDNANRSVYEKGKAKADYFLQKGRYFLALRIYQDLLREIPVHEKTVRSGILHNIGVVYARMFYFKEAAKSFLDSYEVLGSEEALGRHLIAQRMYLTPQEYLHYLEQHPDFHAVSLKVERSWWDVSDQFEATDENRMLFVLKMRKEEGKAGGSSIASYYSEVDKLAGKLKSDYRDMIAKG